MSGTLSRAAMASHAFLPRLVGKDDLAHLMHILFMEGKHTFASPNCMPSLKLV
jgi:hypothetical protein